VRLSAASLLLLGIEIATSSPLWQHRRLPRRQLVTSPASSPLTTVIATLFSPSRRMSPPHSPIQLPQSAILAT
jgi:hypothetical protein